MSILKKTKSKFSVAQNNFSEVFLCPQESWTEDGGSHVSWRLVGPADALKSIGEKFGLRSLQNSAVPYFLISEAEREKIKKFGIVERAAAEIFSDENLKAKILTSPGSLKKSPRDFKCEKCGGLEAWLPRAPGIIESDLAHWRCMICKPSPSPGIIAKRRGPAWEALERERAAIDAVMRQEAYQQIVVATETPACGKCGGSWVIERPSLEETRWVCWACQSPIDAAAYWSAVSSPPPWKTRPSKREAARRIGGRNGIREKVAMQR